MCFLLTNAVRLVDSPAPDEMVAQYAPKNQLSIYLCTFTFLYVLSYIFLYIKTGPIGRKCHYPHLYGIKTINLHTYFLLRTEFDYSLNRREHIRYTQKQPHWLTLLNQCGCLHPPASNNSAAYTDDYLRTLYNAFISSINWLPPISCHASQIRSNSSSSISPMI